MYIEDFREILERIQSDDIKSEKYIHSLNSVDSYLSEFIENNEYAKLNIAQNFFLLNKIFEGNQELYDWMSWYLYDRQFLNVTNKVEGKNGVVYHIDDIESFMTFITQECNLKMKSK